ncbi:MAG: small metal-binding protein SmbP [Gammaproteobacteria bacterium]
MSFDPAFGYTANSFNRNWVINMTYKKTLAALVAGTLTAFGAGAYDVTVDSVAHKSPHQVDALKHAQEAVAAGKQDNAAAVVEHAEEAQKHAIMAQKEFSSYKLQNAAKHLQEAINYGKQGDAKVATTHAEEAVKVLKSDTPLDPNQP